jgi:uncharacterized membrane protein
MEIGDWIWIIVIIMLIFAAKIYQPTVYETGENVVTGFFRSIFDLIGQFVTQIKLPQTIPKINITGGG